MLDTAPSPLRRNVEQAIRLRESHTDLTEELKQRFAGPMFRKDWGLPDMHENLGYEWVTNIVPNLVFTNPKVCVKHDGAPDKHPVVEAAADGLNTWIHSVNLARVLEAFAVDEQFDFAVGIITMEATADVPGLQAVHADELAGAAGQGFGIPDEVRSRLQGIPALRPMIYRIPPTRYFRDHQCGDQMQPRLEGHIFIEDLDDMLAAVNADGSRRYDEHALKACAIDDGLEEIRRKAMQSQDVTYESRKQIVGYEVFVPETGMIYCLSKSAVTSDKGEESYLRPPRKYVGPATGPYYLFGCQIVPDQVYPLSPLMAIALEEEEINAHAGQASEDAGSAKKFVVVNGKGVAKLVKGAGNAEVVVVSNFDGKLKEVTIGGPNPVNLDYIERLRAKANRRIGLTDSVSGNITGATAEEIHTAQANRNLRVRKLQSKFREGVVQLLTIVLSQMWHNPACRWLVKRTDPSTGEQTTGIFIGGQWDDPQSPGAGLLFDGVRVEIEPYSMEAVDEAVLQRNTQTFGGLVASVSQQIISEPWMKWRAYLNDQGEALNIRNAADRYVDWDMVATAQQLNNPILFGIVPPGMAGPPGMAPGGGGPPPGATAPAPPQAPRPPAPPSQPRPGSGPTTNARASGAARRPAQLPART